MNNTQLWRPSSELISNSNMMHFMQFVNQRYQTTFTDYFALYEWSIANKEFFWQSVSDFFKVKFSQTPLKICEAATKMYDTRWFSGATMNFAENLLQKTGADPALIFINEKSQRKQVSWDELRDQVMKIAQGLRDCDVQIGDRIVAVMPNMPETIIAMLATSSLGAIWSSCSPDFGVDAIVERFAQIEPKILFISDGHLYNEKEHDASLKIRQLQSKIPTLEKIVIVPYLNPKPPGDAPKTILWEDFLANDNAKAFSFTQLPFDHPLYIMFSSGTTGLPKCIVHGAGGTLLQHLKELGLHTNLKSGDRIFYYTTCGWMMWNWYLTSLALGATVIQYDGSPFHPQQTQMFNLIDAEKINVFGTSATFISTCEKYDLTPKRTHTLSSLQTILSTGSPLVPTNFEYVYQKIKSDLCLSSISGGTDIISCFALGNPILPVFSGELQCIGLGMNVEIFNEDGIAVVEEKGELVCTDSFPSMPLYFWNDANRRKFIDSYFTKFPNVWTHGDYAEITKHKGLIIYGRSDATLNASGIRIGTAEIYRQVEKIPEILDSVVVGQAFENDVRIILFIKLINGKKLNETLKKEIRDLIRTQSSPHHVPAKIIQVEDIPKTMSGKTVELAIRDTIHNRPIKNLSALANPEALKHFRDLPELEE